MYTTRIESLFIFCLDSKLVATIHMWSIFKLRFERNFNIRCGRKTIWFWKGFNHYGLDWDENNMEKCQREKMSSIEEEIGTENTEYFIWTIKSCIKYRIDFIAYFDAWNLFQQLRYEFLVVNKECLLLSRFLYPTNIGCFPPKILKKCLVVVLYLLYIFCMNCKNHWKNELKQICSIFNYFLFIEILKLTLNSCFFTILIKTIYGTITLQTTHALRVCLSYLKI